MRNAYLLHAWSGRLTLSPKILELLNLNRDSLLYGVRESSDDENEPPKAILSPIPVRSWGSAHKIIICTAGGPGQISKAAGVLARDGVNILSLWGAAFSASGETNVTAIVELPAKLLPPMMSLRDVQGHLAKALTKSDCLSRSSLFRGRGALSTVRLTKLRVLSKFADLYGKSEQCHINMRDWTLDLSAPPQLLGPELDPRTTVLVAPDTEERYMRLAVLSKPELMRISFRAVIASTNSRFSGYVESAVSTLAKHGVNIYSASTLVAAKGQDITDGKTSVPTEEVDFSITGDIQLCKKRSGKDWENRLKQSIEDSLKSHARNNAATVKEIHNSLRVSELSSETPLVFLATNVKPSLGPKYVGMALKLIHAIKSHGLYPVNVDLSLGDSLLSEVSELIDLCPIVVSLYVPEKANQLDNGARTKCTVRRYAPSDYTMYEEAYARARRDKVLLRLCHENVFPPRFIGDQIYRVFNDKTFDRELAVFNRYLVRILRKDAFAEARVRCAKASSESTVSWKLRDIEDWLNPREKS